ncbi:MAG: SPFH domain-containing protein [Verrucomicrobiota bacterium]|nr:SPFH domain-containing protein [Limisphaera sp.]MDW8382786.1 SPFH domain-containing protein [Verrucomicrobiota bacterium]
MRRSYQKYGLINLLTLLGVAAAAFGAARYVDSLAGHVAALHLGLGALVAFVSWFQLRLEEQEAEEQWELDEMLRAKGQAALFGTEEAELLPARRARKQFERFFVPVFTFLLFVLQATGLWWLWRWLDRQTLPPVAPPLMAMSFFGLFSLVLFLIGKFSSTLARLENQRLLRPSGDYVLFGAYLCMIAAAAVVGVEAGWPRTDLWVARVLVIVLGVVALETALNLILEIYRPRLKGQKPRPVYESRLVGLLSRPEGLVTTAAEALDYQFGFKVSETWFYKFLERALGWLLLLQLAVLLLSTCFVVVEPGQQALLERFGRPAGARALLGPGLHVKWPWPIEKVYRYRTEEIQTLTVGIEPEEPRPGVRDTRTVVWSVAHGKEDLFMVATRDETRLTRSDREDRSVPPVSFLAVNVPIHFQIRDVQQWAYGHQNAAALLEKLATREIVRYLVSADLGEIMSEGRARAAAELRDRIQRAAEQRQLGVQILFVGLQGIHPPVKVAPEYARVVSAWHTRRARILDAQADAIRTNALASAQAFVLTNNALAERLQLEQMSLARAAAFTNQEPAFRAAPNVYPMRAYLQAFLPAVADTRKYVLWTTNVQDIIQVDLQDRIRQDLLDVALPTSRASSP